MSLLGKKLLSLLNNPKKRKKSQEIPSYDKAEKIGILYTYGDEKKEETIQLLRELIDDRITTEVLCYSEKKEAVQTDHPTFSIEHLNNWGKVNSPEAEQFMNTPFDFLIHLDFDLNEIMKNMLIHTKAKCRVGFHSENGLEFYELMIGMNKNAGTSNFAEQTIKYIKAIR